MFMLQPGRLQHGDLVLFLGPVLSFLLFQISGRNIDLIAQN